MLPMSPNTTVRRPDLGSPGVIQLSYFSSEPIAPGKAFWCIQLDEHTSRSTALFLCSFLGLLQMLMRRVETRGTYSELSESGLLELLIPRAGSPLASAIENNFAAYELIEFPSLLEQYQDRFKERVELDTAVLKALGYSDGESAAIIDEIYPILVSELTSLKESMSRA